ncbi:MAG TPA: pyridoxal phosphate-dependent aminotransferase, partial [Polyangiaceae bacterium]|nr:pyridoxal phosphate-dependent aminotransferase [Polyangiaceae bacterium]
LAETRAIQRCFGDKRDRLVRGLGALGVRLDREPDATFYCWGSVAGLPPGLDDGMAFFRAALEKKVITVPGQFFDVNPGKRRAGRASRFAKHVRFSFGPSEDVCARAIARLEAMIRERR